MSLCLCGDFFIPKKKNPASGKPAGPKCLSGLTLAVLEAFTRAGLTVLLAFPHAGIARQETLSLERGAEGRVCFDQRASQTVANGTSLAVRAATFNVHADVELAHRVGRDQRLQGVGTLRFEMEIVFDRATVDGHFARPCGQTHPRDGGFAAASSEIFRSCHEVKVVITGVYAAILSWAGC